MILLNFSNSDPAIFGICDWLTSFNVQFDIVTERNNTTEFKDLYIGNDNFQLDLFAGKYTNYWCRRSSPIKINYQPKYNFSGQSLVNQKSEIIQLTKGINQILEKEALNGYQDNNVSKIYNLYLADSVGLQVPKTLITNKKKSLLDFYNSCGRIINKSIDNTSFFKNEQTKFTTEISRDEIYLRTDEFEISLFQEFIEKEFEVRSLYLNGKFYSSCSIAMKKSKSYIDSRISDSDNPARVIPFKIPRLIEKKIIQFMKLANLNFGFIDLICSNESHFYFLEVNPFGMFGALSWPMNYQIEKEIAIELMKNEKKDRKKR